MLQIIRQIFKDFKDSTDVSLLFANQVCILSSNIHIPTTQMNFRCLMCPLGRASGWRYPGVFPVLYISTLFHYYTVSQKKTSPTFSAVT